MLSCRFECNNRIQFALELEKQAHEAALKRQRADLLNMFQKDREELIEDSKIELVTLQRSLDNEFKIKTETEVRLSCEEVERSTNDKINELTELNHLLKSEIEEMEKIVHDEVEYVLILSNYQILKPSTQYTLLREIVIYFSRW